MEDHVRASGAGTAARRAWPIVVRRARATDREAVVRFASDTWDGWDYIPDVFDDWLVSVDGVFLAVEAGQPPDGAAPLDATGATLDPGTPIAITRVTRLTSDEGWLEGIRVDPRVRGMEVASDLQTAELHWLTALGAAVVRYMTSERNQGSLRLGARDGLLPVGRWRTLAEVDELGTAEDHAHEDELARALAGPLAALRPTGALTADDWSTWLAADPTFQAGHGLYERRPWAFQALTTDALVEHVALGEAMTWPAGARTPDAVQALAIVPRPDDEHRGGIRVAFLGGQAPAALSLIDAVLAALASGDAGHPAHIALRPPESSPLVAGDQDGWLRRGFAFQGTASIVVERRVDATHPIPPIDPARLILEDYPSTGGGQR